MKQRGLNLALITGLLVIGGGPAVAQMSSFTPFAQLPPLDNQVLDGKKVVTEKGEEAGKISGILIPGGGTIIRVGVLLKSSRTVVLNAGDVRYDKKNNVVVTRIPLESLNKRSRETF